MKTQNRVFSEGLVEAGHIQGAYDNDDEDTESCVNCAKELGE